MFINIYTQKRSTFYIYIPIYMVYFELKSDEVFFVQKLHKLISPKKKDFFGTKMQIFAGGCLQKQYQWICFFIFKIFNIFTKHF